MATMEQIAEALKNMAPNHPIRKTRSGIIVTDEVADILKQEGVPLQETAQGYSISMFAYNDQTLDKIQSINISLPDPAPEPEPAVVERIIHKSERYYNQEEFNQILDNLGVDEHGVIKTQMDGQEINTRVDATTIYADLQSLENSQEVMAASRLYVGSREMGAHEGHVNAALERMGFPADTPHNDPAFVERLEQEMVSRNDAQIERQIGELDRRFSQSNTQREGNVTIDETIRLSPEQLEQLQTRVEELVAREQTRLEAAGQEQSTSVAPPPPIEAPSPDLASPPVDAPAVQAPPQTEAPAVASPPAPPAPSDDDLPPQSSGPSSSAGASQGAMAAIVAQHGVFGMGSAGDHVTELQAFLTEKGYDVGTAGADGIMGPDTVAALKAFQQENGLAADGIVGPNTLGAIDRIQNQPLQVETPQQTIADRIPEWNQLGSAMQTALQQAQQMGCTALNLACAEYDVANDGLPSPSQTAAVQRQQQQEAALG